MKKIDGFPNYAVDKNGNIWSWCNNKWGLRDNPVKLKAWVGGHGYLCVTLRNKNGIKKRKVHQLVLEAFIGKRCNGQEGCHNDGNILNNSLLNLRWDTHKNNCSDTVGHGKSLRGTKSPNSKLNEKQVRVIKCLLRNSVLSQHEIASYFSVSRSSISLIKRGANWAWL